MASQDQDGAANDHTVFIPLLTASRPEICAPPRLAPACPIPGALDWTPICGGFGRVRDMFATGDGHVLAVGDGAAELSVVGPGQPVFTWSPQLGERLAGLNDLSVVSVETLGCAQPPCFWAVGERGLIARSERSCWSRYTDGRQDGVTLWSSDIAGKSGGWAVGQTVEGGRTHAALRVLRYASGSTQWFDHTTDAADLPPLTDVQVFTGPAAEEFEAWAVGGVADAGGQFVHAALEDGYRWHWRGDQPAEGRPRELAMTDLGSSGWAFGPGSDPVSSAPALVGWRFGRGTGWQQASFAEPGRELVDVYLADDPDGQPKTWIGVSPGPSTAPLLFRWVKGDSAPVPVGGPPPSLDRRATDGNRAIAPLVDGRVVYAWGDEIWLLERATGDWRRARRRLRLTDVAPAARGLWLLADGASGPALLTLDDTGLHPAAGLDDQPDGAAGLPHLRALDTAGSDVWAVGDEGVSLRARGAIGRWQWVTHSDPSQGSFRAIDVTPAGEVWAAGVGADGHGRVWRFDDGVWQVWARTTAATALNAVASIPDGEVWASGDGVVLSVSPTCAPGPSGGCTIREQAIAAEMVAVAALDHETVWAAGGPYIVENASRIIVPDVLEAGGSLIALAVAAPDDVWAAYVCCDPDYEPDRKYSAVIHFDGTSWHESTVINVRLSAMNITSDGDQRTLWLAGDWSTVVRHTYSWR